MDRPATHMPLLERILQAPHRAVVVRGPAAAGKTATLLDLYHHCITPGGAAGCLLLAPNGATVASLRRRLLDATPAGVLVAPRVTTFAALAERMLAASHDGGAVLPAYRRQLLLRRIVDELAATGKLTALAAVADTPGIIIALDRAIAELKRHAVEPDELARAAAPAGKDRDLLAVYRRYQQVLMDARLYDVEGQMWHARDVLAAACQAGAPLPGLDGISAVAADGFTDFTPTQLAMLALLARRLDRVVITLPHDEDGRDRMWHWTTRTLNGLRRELGDELVEISAEPQANPLQPLWRSVFDLDAAAQPLPDGLHVIAAAGAEAEVAAVARRVKQLLAGGEDPRCLAVLARSLEGYRPIIQRVFAEHDVPLAPATIALADVPIVRFALDAAAIAPHFPFRDVLGVIASSYFRPAALGAFGPRHVAAAQMLIREGNVLEGRQAYSDAVERLSRRAERSAELDDEELALGTVRVSHELLCQAGQMLTALFDAAEAADSPAGVLRLIDDFALERAARDCDDDELLARDLRALAELRTVLAAAGSPAPPIAELRSALAAAGCPPQRGEALVDVLDVLDARALRYRHVFLVGLSEGGFPIRLADSSLIGQGERARWAGGGVELDLREDLTAREMLLFYLAASRATATLTLSYLESDAGGRASAPGTFLQSLLDPFGGLDAVRRAGRLSRIAPGELGETNQATTSRREAMILGVAGAMAPGAAPAPAELAWAAASQPRTLRHLCSGLLARGRRWRGGQCDRYDGRLDDPQLLAELRGRFPERTVFSASQLNSYGHCPWQFFAHYVLKLQPLAEPTRRLEAVGAGLFMHSVLFAVFRGLGERAGGSFSLADFGEADVLAALDEAVAGEAAPVEAAALPYPLLWQVQKNQMRRQLAEYLLTQRAVDDARVRHLHFELGFGLERAEGQSADDASTAEPLPLATPAGTILVRGRIDRVDHVVAEGGAGLFVVDYKSGSLPSQADIRDGRSLQLPLYAVAAQRLAGDGCIGGAFHHLGGGREVHFSALRQPQRDKRTYGERLAEALGRIGQFVEGMASGRFDALPTRHCQRWCPYRHVCGYSPARAQLKTPQDDGAAEGEHGRERPWHPNSDHGAAEGGA